MHKILFICHGNICRSPMAEFLLKDMVAKRGIASQFDIASAATSREEIGNPVHHGTRKKLAQFGISVAGKTARQMTRRDYENYDYIIAMDRNNLRNIDRIIGRDDYNKVNKTILLSLQRLKQIPEDFRIFPGHGPAATLGDQRRYNPYLR